MKLSINLFCGNRFTNLLLSLLFFCLQANAQKTISGIVSDESGPLPGVSIVEKGTSNGTVSDFDGAFTISVANENATIVFSYLGFLTQEQSNLQNDSLDIQMLEDVQGLEEIVVTGYGTQKKATLTGSIATINGEALEKSASPNLGTALAGKVTGVFIDTGNGAPGADNPAIRVRGTNTFNNSSALIVIDGIPNRAGGLTRINPADIESISVLKDASAAIYGARAANGVILITTKRGRKGDAIYYFNQYSFKLDSLKERGVWEVAFLEKKSLKDTFLITILSKNKITLKSQILDSTHFSIFEEGRKTRFTRIH
jgi:TonB-dependent SusC/RagA subfamily outer membrane receptor